MKNALLVLVLLSSGLAHATQSFLIVGGTDGTAYNANLAQADAIDTAQALCAPLNAVRISGWKYQFMQYGRSYLARAEFVCSELAPQ